MGAIPAIGEWAEPTVIRCFKRVATPVIDCDVLSRMAVENLKRDCLTGARLTRAAADPCALVGPWSLVVNAPVFAFEFCMQKDGSQC